MDIFLAKIKDLKEQLMVANKQGAAESFCRVASHTSEALSEGPRARTQGQFLHDPAWGLLMGSLFGDWPSYNPHNFSQLKPSDPSHSLQLTPATYYATHNRTIPPAHQVISTEVNNILLRHFHQSSEEKVNLRRSRTFCL
ncbi:hypothetical protein L7F22_022355 [Adiantum nelumboides]|nr:hypothetical protein [Adiantum nelumboides]